MKLIKIDGNNRNKISELLTATQEKCDVNLLSVEQVFEFANQAETKLDEMGISVKNRNTAEFYYQPPGPMAKSYRFRQGATTILIIRKSKNWFVSEIKRIKVYPCSHKVASLILTPTQRDLVIDKFCRCFITKDASRTDISL
jgi:hypothetical protein